MRILLAIFFLIWLSPKGVAQEDNVLQDVNVDDLGNVSDEFQELFFEALKQKGIENYELAITALDKCIKIKPKESILYFEKGKNLASLGQTLEAEQSYLKALELKPNQEDILESLYEVYYAQQDFEKALNVLSQLAKFDLQYKEDMARIYVRTRKFEKALSLLDELDEKLGKDAYRNMIRDQIYTQSEDGLLEKDLLSRIAKNPNEQDFLKLIYVYSAEGETQKAYETAQQLLKLNPNSEAVHIALYKFNLESGAVDKAIASMQKVLKSESIEPETKHSLLNDFLLFTEKNPEYETELENAISLFQEKEDLNLNSELAEFYLKKNDKSKALEVYLDAYKNNSTDPTVLKNLALLLLDVQDFNKAAEISEEAMILFPAQPLFYLSAGVAYNGLQKPDEAIDYLEMGVDFVIENNKMQADFYNQLARAYELKGDATKAADYKKKASQLTQ